MACNAVSERMEAYFHDFVNGVGMRQSYVMTINGLVNIMPFNADTIGRAKEARELHKRMGHPSVLELDNALPKKRTPRLTLPSET